MLKDKRRVETIPPLINYLGDAHHKCSRHQCDIDDVTNAPDTNVTGQKTSSGTFKIIGSSQMVCWLESIDDLVRVKDFRNSIKGKRTG